jgi:hypothetical protein
LEEESNCCARLESMAERRNEHELTNVTGNKYGCHESWRNPEQLRGSCLFWNDMEYDSAL